MNITKEQLMALSAAVTLAGYYIDDRKGSAFFEKGDLLDYQKALAALNELENQLLEAA